MPRGQAKYKSRFVASKSDCDNFVVWSLRNKIMISGKKAKATRIVNDAIAFLNERSKGADASATDLELFLKVIEIVSPKVEVKSKRIGGATYQAPVQLNDKRKLALAIRLIVKHSRGRSEKTMALRLAGEFLDILEERGGAMKERENMHKMAKANQAFANLR